MVGSTELEPKPPVFFSVSDSSSSKKGGSGRLLLHKHDRAGHCGVKLLSVDTPHSCS